MTHDARIDPITGDMSIPTSLITGPELTAQRARVRLATFFGEWILDQFVGLPFLAWRQQKPPDVDAIGAVVLAELISTPGVIRVDSFEGAFNPLTRTVTFQGDVTIEIVDPADEATLAFRIELGGGNTTPAVIAFHPTSGRIAPL